jgi:thymidylate kinase
MEIRPIIIHIDGPDKTGKDSIRREVVIGGKGNYLVYVRSFLSQIVYSRLYNRKINEDYFFHKWITAQISGEKFFFIDCSYELVKERFMKHNEQDLDIKDWKDHRRVFYDVIKEAEERGIKINRIDTTIDSINNSAENIIKEITE